MAIKRESKAILPKPYDGKVSQEKLINKLIEVWRYCKPKYSRRTKLTDNEDGTIETMNYKEVYDNFYKHTYETPFIHSIQCNTAEIYSYLKEHYHIVYYMLYGRPSYEDFMEHITDFEEELQEMFNEILKYKQ